MDFIIRNENYSVFYEDMSTFIEEQDSLSLQFEIMTFYRIDMIISIGFSEEDFLLTLFTPICENLHVC